MSDFKYLNVVESDNVSQPTEIKPQYKILDFSYRDQRTLIIPLHGATPDHAAQMYLFEHPREFMVYVQIALPEYKYEKTEITLMSRNPMIQAQLKRDTEELDQL